MRIAQVSPLYESCPPQLYGGTERVVSYLTEELIRQGHEVTLFASGDSRTAAMLQAPCKRAPRLDPLCRDPLVYHFIRSITFCVAPTGSTLFIFIQTTFTSRHSRASGA